MECQCGHPSEQHDLLGCRKCECKQAMDHRAAAEFLSILTKPSVVQPSSAPGASATNRRVKESDHV